MLLFMFTHREAKANACSDREELQAEEGSLATLGWITGSEALELRGVVACADVKRFGVGVVDGVAFVEECFDCGFVIVGGVFELRGGSRGFGCGGCLIGYGNGKLGCLPIVREEIVCFGVVNWGRGCCGHCWFSLMVGWPLDLMFDGLLFLTC